VRHAVRAAAALGLGLAALPGLAAPTLPHQTVVLQTLDKVTARTGLIEAPVGEEMRLGTLGITARTCLETPPTEPPESAAFLEIRALEPGKPPEPLFTGWMFASTPALSALEHPVYDVWVLDCAHPLATPDEPAAAE
jgi:hypothetical protein